MGLLFLFYSSQPLATTHPIPALFAFFIARSMQKFPTTTPIPLHPSTHAVAADSLIIRGTASLLQPPCAISST